MSKIGNLFDNSKNIISGTFTEKSDLTKGIFNVDEESISGAVQGSLISVIYTIFLWLQKVQISVIQPYLSDKGDVSSVATLVSLFQSVTGDVSSLYNLLKEFQDY